MDKQKILTIMERETWYLNRSMWMIAMISLFAYVVILPYLGGTIVMDDLTSLQIAFGIGVLCVIGYLADKSPPKSLKTKI